MVNGASSQSNNFSQAIMIPLIHSMSKWMKHGMILLITFQFLSSYYSGSIGVEGRILPSKFLSPGLAERDQMAIQQQQQQHQLPQISSIISPQSPSFPTSNGLVGEYFDKGAPAGVFNYETSDDISYDDGTNLIYTPASSVENELFKTWYIRRMLQRMKNQMESSSLQHQKKRNNGNYWKMCAFNAVSCFG